MSEVKFELQGFNTLTRPNVAVTMAATRTVDVHAHAADGDRKHHRDTQPADIAPAVTIASNFKKDMLELLPVGRTLNAGVLLAPVWRTGRGDIMMSGALLRKPYLVNGVVINENLRGQALSLFIEDAIQETKVSTGAISAEPADGSGAAWST